MQLPNLLDASQGKQLLAGKPLLLFSLGGVLLHHTKWYIDPSKRSPGEAAKAHQYELRPGIHQLLRLLPHFRLGIYSSAAPSTTAKALNKLQGSLASYVSENWQAAAAGGTAADHRFPAELPPELFEVELAKHHCRQAKKSIAARGGKKWDIFKPLGKYFAGSFGQVALVEVLGE